MHKQHKHRFWKITSLLTLIIIALSAHAAPVQDSAVDPLTLHIVNDSSYTLTLTNMLFGPNVKYYILKETTIRPQGTAEFQAAADVSSAQPTQGLGGTLYFTIDGTTQKFIIADLALGANLMPIIGFGINNPYVTSTVSNITIKKNPKSYDLAIQSATVTIIDKLKN